MQLSLRLIVVILFPVLDEKTLFTSQVIIIIIIIKHVYSARPSKPFSGTLQDKNTQKHKFHLVKGRFKQMCLKKFSKAPIDLHTVIGPSRRTRTRGRRGSLLMSFPKYLSRMHTQTNKHFVVLQQSEWQFVGYSM